MLTIKITKGDSIMQEDNRTVLSEVYPDLFIAPHVLPLLMELLMGDRSQAHSQEQQLHAHLAVCDYCGSAVIFLLGVEQAYDRINNNDEEPIRALLTNFARTRSAIEKMEAHAYERLGTYAQAVVNEGRAKADLRFPDIVIHLGICPDCCTMLEATLSFIVGSTERTD
jgi:hypothetical protein